MTTENTEYTNFSRRLNRASPFHRRFVGRWRRGTAAGRPAHPHGRRDRRAPPVQAAGQKIKKQQGLPEIKLENTIDILGAIAERRSQTGYPRRVVGFAAESQDIRQNAQSKLATKHLDMIVANDITAPDAGFEVPTNRVTLVFADGLSESLPTLAKEEVGEIIIQKIISMEGLR